MPASVKCGNHQAGTNVATLPPDVARAFWDAAADRLFLVSISGGTVWSWSEFGLFLKVGI